LAHIGGGGGGGGEACEMPRREISGGLSSPDKSKAIQESAIINEKLLEQSKAHQRDSIRVMNQGGQSQYTVPFLCSIEPLHEQIGKRVSE
jgi:hypothetical protein